ncbi:MAG: ABC transporter ATP-binding protein [Rhodospirillales bacterium]|nr:ABC transporter ATP-binding protein [Rhodospirillales bacterium]
MIRVENLHLHFGGIRAVDGVSVEIEEESITGLIGPNGAGKTTLFNVIAGVYPPSEGRVFLQEQEITGLKPHQLFHRGVLRTFQIAHEFSSLTVLENLTTVPGGQAGETLVNAWFRRGKVRVQEAEIRDRAWDVVTFLGLERVATERAGALSGGQKKLLELGRTMMAEPQIVFLDEVGAGVNRTLLRSIGDAILRLNRERGYTFCMIEHDIDFISRLCQPVIVMAEGKVLTQGSPAEVKADQRVIDSYLGRGRRRGASAS